MTIRLIYWSLYIQALVINNYYQQETCACKTYIILVVMLGKLVVRVYRAEGLASADINGKSDPFIKMNLVNQYHRTSTQYKTLNPEWNEMFHFDVHDINNHLDFLVYDEDRHGEDFLGRIIVPLLSIKNKQMVWYQLKNKKLQNSAKGRLLIRMDIEWSVVKACIRTFNPLEELKDPPPAQLRKSLMMSNFMRAKTQVMMIVNCLKYVKSCFSWESKIRSLNAFTIFLVITYYFELWMVPFALLVVFSFNYLIISSPFIREILGFDEAKYSSLVDIRHMMANDDSLDDLSSKFQFNKEPNNNNSSSVVSATGGKETAGSGASFTDPDEDKTIVEKIQAGKDVIILVQDLIGHVASYLERVTNTFTFKVPFLSFLMMFCLLVATILLYLVPLRYIIMAWGINKFTKKLRAPNAIDNNELLDFLSRVPDNIQCVKAQNVVSY